MILESFDTIEEALAFERRQLRAGYSTGLIVRDGIIVVKVFDTTRRRLIWDDLRRALRQEVEYIPNFGQNGRRRLAQS
jgi:hypothetical protein